MLLPLQMGPQLAAKPLEPLLASQVLTRYTARNAGGVVPARSALNMSCMQELTLGHVV